MLPLQAKKIYFQLIVDFEDSSQLENQREDLINKTRKIDIGKVIKCKVRLHHQEHYITI